MKLSFPVVFLANKVVKLFKIMSENISFKVNFTNI